MNQYETINHTYERVPMLKSSGRPWQPADCSPGTGFTGIKCRTTAFNKNPPNDCLGPTCRCNLVGGTECGTYQGENLFCEPQGAPWDSYYWDDVSNNQGVCQ